MEASRLELAVVATGERAEHFVDPTFVDSTGADEDDEDTTASGHELAIAINGILELRRWGGIGMEPDVLLNPGMPLLPSPSGEPTDVVVQRCGCGDVGCGSLTLTITRIDDKVRWFDVRERDVPVDIGPFSFDAAEYEAELRRAHQDRSWESRAERIARLVTDQLRPEHGARPLSFEWAMSWSATSVEVSYVDYRPNPNAGQTHPLNGPNGASGWFTVEPDELSDQHIGSFSIDATGSDEAAVSEIVHQVRTTHPRTWPRSSASDW